LGKALEIISGFVTQPTTFTNLTMATGDSLSIRNSQIDAMILLLQVWSQGQSIPGEIRVRAPELHDNVEGIRLALQHGLSLPLLPPTPNVKLKPQMNLTVDKIGSATASDIESVSLLVYYEDLPGVNGRFISPDELSTRFIDFVTIRNTITNGTAGGYTSSEALNSEFDLLKANTDYALVGALCSHRHTSICYRGTDFGNLRIGIPAEPSQPGFTRNFFPDISRESGLDLIPVISSANLDAITIELLGNENAQATTITTILARLSP